MLLGFRAKGLGVQSVSLKPPKPQTLNLKERRADFERVCRKLETCTLKLGVPETKSNPVGIARSAF